MPVAKLRSKTIMLLDGDTRYTQCLHNVCNVELRENSPTSLPQWFFFQRRVILYMSLRKRSKKLYERKIKKTKIELGTFKEQHQKKWNKSKSYFISHEGQ